LRRAGTNLAPTPGLAPRVLAASLPAFGVLALPVPWEAHLLGSPAVFAVVALAIGAVPKELVHALRR
jgi:hypothetical protein